jgi:hypothetical protein
MSDRQAGRGLGCAVLVLGTALAANAVLGPLLLGVIDYRFGKSLTDQGIGLDAVVLVAVVPLCAVAGLLTLRGHRAGPVLALAPSAFAAYMLPQYVIGPRYDAIPGNSERWFPAHLGLFVLAVAVLAVAWSAIDGVALPPASQRSDRRRSWVMVGVAAFIVLRWLPPVTDLVSGKGGNQAFADNPTAFFLVAMLDLGLVVPAAIAVLVGLRAGACWARKGAYGVIGWFALVPLSVAAMSLTMQVRHAPAASTGATVSLAVVAAVFLTGAALLYLPLLRQSPTAAPFAPLPAPRGAAAEGDSRLTWPA